MQRKKALASKRTSAGNLWLRGVILSAALLALAVAVSRTHSVHADARLNTGGSREVAGLLTGVIFQDYNDNGRRDTAGTITNADGTTMPAAVDRGISGVLITAYAADGSIAGTATSGADGSYSLNATGSGPYRVEITNVPAGYQSSVIGTNSQGNVRFVSGGTGSNLDFGLIQPGNVCQDNPTLITSCFLGGAQNSNDPVIVSFPYSSGSTRTTDNASYADFDAPAHGNLVRANQVGTVWGLAYARSTQSLYAAAFMKKHAGFGPGGPGAIYRINPTTGATTTFVNANALQAGIAGIDPHNPADYDRDNGNVAWDAVGKVAFGGIALNGAETRLYAMNLADRSLYEFPTDAAITAANVRKVAAPTNLPGCPSAADARPFAVQWNEGALYVGLTCTAESTVSGANPAGDASKLAAYVYRVDPATLAFGTEPVFQFALNYPRRCTDNAQNGPSGCFSAAWRPWTTGYANIGTDGRGIYPQPWLTDLAFDRGNLILGLRDRAGDQFGTDTLDNPMNDVAYYGVSAGDTLRACANASGTGWTLESNGRCGGQGTAPQNTGEGPGGGEFYFGDFAPPYNDENGLGALVQVPGFPQVVVNSYDPIPFTAQETLFDGGSIWMDNTTGARVKSYRVYDGVRNINTGDDFGKANGLGDLIAICNPAPIEIGNRVWLDRNGNGIQDADEPGIAGVKVELIKNAVKVGEAITAADGSYLFNASNVSGGLLAQMDYEICIDKLQTPVAALGLTARDADGSENGDTRDSDASMFGDRACISARTLNAGMSNYNYDFGFVAVSITCPTNITATAAAGATGTVVNFATPTVTPAGTVVNCTPASGSTFPLGTTTVSCSAGTGASAALCSFTVTVAAAPSLTCPTNQTVTVNAGVTSATVNYTTPTAPSGTVVNCTPASGTAFALGNTTVTCTATNSAGTTSCSFVVRVVDRPSLVCPTNITTNATSASGATVNFTTPTGTGLGTTVTCDRTSGGTFPVGTTTVTCTATNEAGTASCTFSVIVNASPAPTITCPGNQTITVDAGVTSAAVTYTTPTSSDGSPVTCTPASGASFALGNTTVTCTTSNATGSNSCSFIVRVVDRPAIVCPTNVQVTATSADGAAVTFVTPTITGLGATVTCDRTSGSTFPVGTTAVKCTVTNEAGMAMCTFNVVVTPQVKCDTLCYRSPQFWMLNLFRVPGGSVQIIGSNGNQTIDTRNRRALQLALQGNPFGFGLTSLQLLNQQYVAAQLNILNAGGPGSPVVFNTMWANLSCYGIQFSPVTLSNGAVLNRDSMVKDLYMQITAAINERRSADYQALGNILLQLNGTDPLGFCN